MTMTTATDMMRYMFDRFDVAPRPLQEWAYNTSKNGKNMIVVAPTGSGKTEAAYIASKNWGRTTYALPMKTLANDIHSRLTSYEQRVTGQEWHIQHSSHQTDSHLAHDFTVTTIDQVLSGYLGFGRESFIRGKNLLRNHLILDEVQLFDPERALLSLLNLLEQTTSKPFGNHFCMMTATFPTVLHDYLKSQFDTETYIETTPPVSKEVTLEWEDSMPYSRILEYSNKQIIVCNTQQQQVDLYHTLLSKGVDPERLIVLNSRLYPEDRDLIERQVQYYFGKSSEENNKILISTQIVEAGMDISADTLWSFEAPVDSLIQREGRCARWGGKGTFTVVKQETSNGKHPVYDSDLVNNTSTLVQTHKGTAFSWEKQLEWIDAILNPFYEEILHNVRKRKRFEKQLKEGSSNDLIRNIQSVNVIPILNPAGLNETDFLREGISLPAYLVPKGWVWRDKNILETRPYNGETVIVDAKEWTYDGCGFRKGDGTSDAPFASDFELDEAFYEDYIEETLNEHLTETAVQMVSILQSEAVIPEKTVEYDAWTIGTAHDIGKATKPWQKMIRWNGDGTFADNDTIYAHRPWIPRSNRGIRGLTHSHIGVVLLSDQLTPLEKQVIQSHHGRIFATLEPEVNGTDWEEGTTDLLQSLGFLAEPLNTSSHRFSKKDFLTPADPNWATFVYLTGALMQADRQAIHAVKERKREQEYPFIDKTTTI